MKMPTNHALDSDVISHHKHIQLKDSWRTRTWLVTTTCKNCPEYFRGLTAVDSKESIIEEFRQWRCPICEQDSLEFHMKDLGPVATDEPQPSVEWKVLE